MVMRDSCELRNNRKLRNRSELELKPYIEEWTILCSEGKWKNMDII